MICGFILLLGFLVPAAEAQTPPRLLHYQGRILQPDSLKTTHLAVTFGLYAVPTQESPLWSETHDLQTTDGLFSVLLGGSEPFPEGVFRLPEVYLSLQTQGTGELLPRQRLVSVAYALRAGEADDVPGAAISPASVALSNGAGTWDATGALNATAVSAGSLNVGGRPVIDGGGNWVGPSAAISGTRLDTIATFAFPDTAGFFFSKDWRTLPNVDVFVDVTGPATVELTYTGQISAGTGFEVRLNHKQVTPNNVQLGTMGSVAGGQPTSGGVGTTVHNHAVLRNVSAGVYRFFVETRGITVSAGVRRSGLLVIKIYK